MKKIKEQTTEKLQVYFVHGYRIEAKDINEAIEKYNLLKK
jgi:imidazoleglycerol phosphate synthase glutamine amidotransferase subunit HisH